MRVLFYLPGITTNWFNDTVVHLIRSAAREHEVHVLSAVPWRGTGLSMPVISAHADLGHVHWHLIDGDDHPSYRTCPESADDLVDFVHQLAPDYTICRAADVDTPQRFPGKTVFLMEAEYAPTLMGTVPRGGRIRVDGPGCFDFGLMAELDAGERDWLRARILPAWKRARAERHDSDRAAALAALGLPADRRIVALPLQYQGEDNFFGQVHGLDVPADRFVAGVADALDGDALVAVSVHPIDLRHGRPLDVIARIRAMDPARVRILPPGAEAYQGATTETLIRNADALALAESKAIAIGAFYGKPVYRQTRHATAPWVNAYTDLGSFAAALAGGTPAVADADAAMIWHAWHFANNAFAGVNTPFVELIGRIERPHDPARWEPSLAAQAELEPV